MNILTHFRLCPLSRGIRMALGELKLPFTLADERPWEGRPQFLALNPAGELPILVLDRGPVLCGSYAISEYLGAMVLDDEAASLRLDLFPGDLDEKAEVRRLVDWFHRKLDREVTRELVIEKITARLTPGGESYSPDVQVLRAVRSNLRYHMRYLDFLCTQRRWLAGDVMSFADIAAAGHLSTLDYLGEVNWDEVGAARQWYQRIKSRPSMRAILADRLPGQPPPAHYDDLDF